MPGGVLRLEEAGGHVAWQQAGAPAVRRPAGWTGSDSVTGVSFSIGEIDRGGDWRPALALHPPWRTGAGTAWVEYPVALPHCAPLTLTFANAIRDHRADEPPSDGVTFRVWVNGIAVQSLHTDSKVWTESEVDLSAWAGQTIALRLESHPGPRDDTTCDSSFWAEPTVWARSRPPRRAEAAWAAALEDARRRLAGPDPGGRFDLGGGRYAVYLPGTAGPHEAVVGFAAGGRTVCFRGVEISIDGRRMGDPRSGFAPGPGPDQFHDGTGTFTLAVRARAEGEAIRLSATVSAGRRITDFALGPAGQAAGRVYFGHGYVVQNPETFRIAFGGHSLSSSHVGVDFANGLSLLTASDAPPVCFDVAPAQRRYALRTRENATLTLVPGDRGAMDCAVRYRPLYDKPAAPGVEAKAGRFVFDLWGGRYREHLDRMRDATAYGLTNCLLTVHVWQRWGYDYRLPDIFPPDPGLGRLEDLQALSEYCRAEGIPWGLHDNYIDFYPDADGFSYRHVAFTADGEPVRAWLNESRGAQSYRWRPDRFQPFLRRNLDWITPALRPTHSFVDVFTSIPLVEFHDREGRFHSGLETRRCWGEAFDTIRASLGAPAITCSEAGHDQLVGHLDGADCQYMYLAASPRRHAIPLACADWERVPWYDAVLHERFVLHGAGYSDRYQAGRPRHLHGIESDDYLGAEILTGHALMIDRPAGLAGAVRKYWLAQPWAEAVAADRIAAVEFADGDLHRLRVRWASGAEAWVNRGADDWLADGRRLPPYGFLASAGLVTCAVERIAGHVVERGDAPGTVYVNSRTAFPPAPHPIAPAAAEVQFEGAAVWRIRLSWEARAPLPAEAMVFVHGLGEGPDGTTPIVFQADHRPDVPTSAWSGAVRTGGQPVRLPRDLAPGRYPVVAGLYLPDGPRFALCGEEADDRRYRIGTLVMPGDGPPHWEPHAFTPPPDTATPAGTPIDFGPVITDGAFRLTDHGESLLLTPLPGSPGMRVTLCPAQCCPGRRISAIAAVRRSGEIAGEVAWQDAPPERVSFATRAGDFAYRIDTVPGPAARGGY